LLDYEKAMREKKERIAKDLTTDWKLNVNAKNMRTQCENDADKLFNGIINEGFKVINEEKVNKKQQINSVNLE
jgi:hypothetical protein